MRSRLQSVTRAIVTMVLLCLSPAAAGAQVQQAEAATERKPHRFWDTTNVSLTILEVGAMTLDGAVTQHGIRRYGARENNPLARPFVERGWPGQIAGGAIYVGSELGVRYLLHRKGRHRLERWLPVVIAIAHTTAAVRGYREIRRRSGLVSELR